MAEVMRVDIWADIICPFCWIGKRQFEAALAGFQGRSQVEVHYHAYRLSPDQPPEPVVPMLMRKYGLSADQVAENQARVTEMARGVGLDYHLENTVSGDSLMAHRLVKLAEDKGLAAVMIERLYKAYFNEGRSILEADSLADLAADVGLDRPEVEAFLKTDRYAQTVREEQDFITSRGANGVPFFVINNRYAVAGAQPTEAFAQVLDRAWNDLPPEARNDNAPSC